MGAVKLIFDKKDPRSVSKTEQSHRASCDINKIIARAEKTGLMPVNLNRGVFGDFSSVDFVDMNIKIAKAKEAFMSLPVAIRSRFGNDVAALLDFVDNPANEEEARELKLIPGLTPEQVKAKNDAARAAEAANAGTAGSAVKK